MAKKPFTTFSELYKSERMFLNRCDEWRDRKALGKPQFGPLNKDANDDDHREPYVTFAPHDRVGVALSGGGIRSATFNLGLLQGLVGLNLLRHVDYLSTVSGGGYVGGWYSAWMYHNNSQTRGSRTTNPTKGTKQSGRKDLPGYDDRGEWIRDETDEIRHLRSFSRFLVPRVGIFEVELWYAIVTILSGVLIGVATAMATLCLCFLIWKSIVTFLWANHSATLSDYLSLSLRTCIQTAFLPASTCVILLCYELWWKWKHPSASPLGPSGSHSRIPANVVRDVQSIHAHFILWFVGVFLLPVAGTSIAWWMLTVHLSVLRPPSMHELWAPHLPFIHADADPWKPHYLYGPAVAWLMSGTALLIVRFFTSRYRKSEGKTFRYALQRSTARLFGAAAAWIAVVTIWIVGTIGMKTLQSSIPAVVGAIGGSVVFARLRDWYIQALAKPREPGVSSKLRPLFPQLLSYAVVVLIATLAAAIVNYGTHEHFLATIICPPVMIVLTLFFFDLETMGLHSFYRDRIARTFLGKPDLETNARYEDDFEFVKLRHQRPIHLVCCAANGQGDNPLGSLYRSAQSAVLSARGISVGNRVARRPRLRFGSALTASAAAFNPNMGSISAKLGPAVRFLMATLNLRLGLWVEDPYNQSARKKRRRRLGRALLPGWFYFREMFGWVYCSRYKDASWLTKLRAHFKSDLHLSDGGHFENLALYELVRRHCRYIILSDCGQDEEINFDDLGNAVRRIRADFGVEIEIDTDPLKPIGKLSKQHMVVGTIHYDRKSDKGILLYFKPTLDGDEPSDVLQYKARNQQFPHEATADQFYDEAQWEAYRRLGEHAVWDALGFVQRMSSVDRKNAYSVFTRARREWYPTPPSLESTLAELNERYQALCQEIHSRCSPAFVREAFPEVAGQLPSNLGNVLSSQNTHSTILMLQQMLRFMQDVVVRCDLDNYASHPLNIGWTNLFKRWSHMPSFRVWWPFLRTMYSPALRHFVQERLKIPALDETEDRSKLVERRGKKTGGLAMRMVAETKAGGFQPNFSFELLLQANQWVEVAIVCVRYLRKRKAPLALPEVASWKSNELFVLPGLWDAGIGSDFLNKLTGRLRNDKSLNIKCCVVKLQWLPENDRAARDLRIDLIDLYAGAGFRLNRHGDAMIMRL